MIVVDTNILVHLYFPHQHNSVVEQVLIEDPEWIAPWFWISEFRNVATKFYRKGLVTLDFVDEVLAKVEEQLSGSEFNASSKSIMQLVSRSECSSYDCEFVALAKEFDTKLVTYDKLVLDQFPEIAFTPEQYLAQLKR
jgi:predicted nucleic acid-binding protein